MQRISDSNFVPVVRDDPAPIILLFVDEGCSLCESQIQTFEFMETQYRDQTRFAVVDLIKSPETAQMLTISTGPAVALFEHSVLQELYLGPMNKSDIRSLINENL